MIKQSDFRFQKSFHAIFDEEFCNFNDVTETRSEQIKNAFVSTKVKQTVAKEGLDEISTEFEFSPAV